MHPVWLLALATFLAVGAFAFFNYRSTRNQQKNGHGTSPSEPLSGSNDGLRSPEAIRRSLNAAEGR